MVAFVQTKYEADSGDIHGIRLTPDYSAAAGTAPTGDVNNSIKVKVSKTNREFGIRPRGVRLSRTVGTAPDTFKKYAFLPVLGAVEFAGAGFAIGTTITIGGIDYTVIAKVPEDF